MVTNGNGKNGNSQKREETAKRIIEAIRDSHGLLTIAAKRAGLGYMTVYRYVHEFPSVAQAAKDAKEAMLDFAEAKLYQKIKDGDNACLIFYLKCQAKDRGYVERQEVTGEGGKPIKHDVTIRGVDEQTRQLLNEVIAGKGTENGTANNAGIQGEPSSLSNGKAAGA